VNLDDTVRPCLEKKIKRRKEGKKDSGEGREGRRKE
jgi:hypothetical protein